MTANSWLATGCVLGGLAVVIGAFGAHTLEPRLSQTPKGLDRYQTGVEYHMYHALALLALGTLAARTSGVAVQVAGWSFLVGIVLFSGSLYAFALTGIRSLGMITPIGGVGFLVGWTALALAALRAKAGP